MADDIDTENDSEGIKQLRKQFETLSKENKELKDSLSTYQVKERHATVGEVLKAKGANPAAAKFYTGDDTSEAAVTKWLDENKDVFGGGTASTATTEESDNVARVNSTLAGNAEPEAVDFANLPIGNAVELTELIRKLPFDELQRRGLMPKSGQLGVR